MFKITTSRLLAGLLVPVIYVSITCCGGNGTAKNYSSNDSTGGSSRDDKPELKVAPKATTTKVTPAIQPGSRTTTNDSTGGSSRDTTSLKKKN